MLADKKKLNAAPTKLMPAIIAQVILSNQTSVKVITNKQYNVQSKCMCSDENENLLLQLKR